MMDDVKIRIENAVSKYGDRLMATTGFGYSGIVLLYHIKEIAPNIPIYFIDTGFHFPETIILKEIIKSEWGLDIRTISNTNVTIDHRNPAQCCYTRKVLPLLDVLKEDTVWLSALRRDQSVTRENIGLEHTDSRGNIKISPLFDKTKDELWAFIENKDLPYNPLHDYGYWSIGCGPCTTSVNDGEHEREGRWRNTDKCECGIHEEANI